MTMSAGVFKHPHLTMKKSYFMLALVYLTGIAAPVNQFKVPPMMQRLISELDISLTASGWLMSSFALAGFVCALPSGVLLQKMGVRRLGLLSMSILLIGSAVGGAVSSVPLILFSRIVEGVGMGLFSVAAPAALSAWFPPEKRGIPMGVWSTWVPAGNVVIFLSAPFFSMSGWRNVWIFSSCYTAVMLLMFFLFFSMPVSTTGIAPKTQDRHSLDVFKVREAWSLAAIFLLFNVITISIKSYLPVFLESVRGFSTVKASGILTIMMLCSMATAPVAGIISDKIHSRKIPVIAGCVLAIVSVLIMFNAPPVWTAVSLVLIGVAGGAMPVGIFTAATELFSKPEKAGACMAVVVFGQYIGMFIGPVLFSFTAEHTGWSTASYMLAAIALTAFFASLRNSAMK
ncbi:major facilitator superfamily MFS_1 [Denitrovibrio acetiphilus DSM 12809]|uniref:Major facilitator superfamily MFS_1 n=2 Tax=Denitrovibrio TaxID=117999 RepID=D4H8R9_DENA2|nr:major facilitator superfamily MFS_1 [Denitrovibrio acetiphilus DSM 12809]